MSIARGRSSEWCLGWLWQDTAAIVLAAGIIGKAQANENALSSLEDGKSIADRF